MIPVNVLTGFLGSGKTTLLNALLRHPQMRRTAVIVNEFGEIAIDHDLIETSDESFVQLSNGCLCCQVRSDLVLTLSELAAGRAAGSLPAFERVVIETSGLADPAPILHALMTDASVRERYVLAGVVTTVDAVAGTRSLAGYVECARQIAFADRIVLTKTDVPQACPESLEVRLRDIHGDCPTLRAVRGQIEPDVLFPADVATRMPAFLATAAPLRGLATYRVDVASHAHSTGMTSVSIVRDEPVHAATLALFVSALAENCGDDLVRVKGIVSVVEDPERPAVIHVVQHVYDAPQWMARWPSADRRTRLVFIGRRLNAQWLGMLLDLLDDEVADQAAKIRMA